MSTELTATRLVAGALPSKKRRKFRLRSEAGGSGSVVLDRDRVRIGSRDENDFVLADPTVSRLHCELVASDVGWRLRDLGSRNGTFIDDLRVVDAYLRPGASIRLGDATLVFEPLDEEVDVPLAREARFGPLVGGSVAMRELYALVERVAPSDVTTLVVGESGTGKELVARALHERSPRHDRAYVVFDCASVAANLLESELFGHERGAFTGAAGARVGVVEEAEGGTLFLDEIGELPLDLQPKLLRLLELREYRRVGSSRARRADVRIVAATHRDLAAMVNAGAFREDLFYRLAVVRLDVPPLRAREGDVPLLVDALLDALAPHEKRTALTKLGEEAWKRLERHSWPGNVRELRNVVQRLVVLGDLSTPTPPTKPTSNEPRPLATPVPMPHLDADTDAAALIDLDRPWMEQKRALVERLEAAYLRAVLDAHEGNYTRAAAHAGIERMYFKRMLAKYGR